MSAFVVHTAQTAPAPADEELAQIGKAWSFVPNLHGILAGSPETLEGYDALFGLVAKTTLSPIEQQVAFLAVNYENECEYCMGGHTVLAGMAKVPAQAIAALRDVLEVILIVAAKTISNYTNHIAHTPNDAFMANTAWTAPKHRNAA